MLNQIVLMGKIKELKDGKMVLNLPSDNTDIEINLGDGIYKKVSECAEIGTLVGVKGSISKDDTGSLCINVQSATVLGKEKDLPVQKKKRNEYER